MKKVFWGLWNNPAIVPFYLEKASLLHCIITASDKIDSIFIWLFNNILYLIAMYFPVPFISYFNSTLKKRKKENSQSKNYQHRLLRYRDISCSPLSNIMQVNWLSYIVYRFYCQLKWHIQNGKISQAYSIVEYSISDISANTAVHRLLHTFFMY